jgi:hypothetical protein
MFLYTTDGDESVVYDAPILDVIKRTCLFEII